MRKSREDVFWAQEMGGGGGGVVCRIDVLQEVQRVWGRWVKRVVMGSVDTGEQGLFWAREGFFMLPKF